MTNQISAKWRRASLVTLVAGLSAMSVVPAISAAHAVPAHNASCPRAESLVPGTHWHVHKLAPGVTLSEGSKEDRNGIVKMHVLRATVGTKGLSFGPLMKRVADRLPLSKLASGHKHLVAAVNTGYFDFFSGAPTVPLIVNKVPLVISPKPAPVVGINSLGRFQSGSVRMRAAVYAGKTKQHVLNDVNEVQMGPGLGVYTPAWGPAGTPSPWNKLVRPVVNGKIGVPIVVGGGQWRGASVPTGGYLLVAKGLKAKNWLRGIKNGTSIGVAAQTRTNAPHPFVQAYGVGVQLVAKPGVAITGFTCNSANTKQPARTAIGFADGGKKVVIAEVEDNTHTSLHGLDNDQMSKLMAQLGVSRAYDWDGSGSTEMLARMPKSSKLSLRTYPADDAERPMPVGFGIFSKKRG